MVKTASTMLSLGTTAPDFSLVNVDGQTVSLANLKGSQVLLVVFMCNHCPFVKHIATELARLAIDYQPQGLAMVGINSNDVSSHPDDSPEQMVHEAELQGYTFAYLFDETQEVAKAYRAACTPDFFLFDGEQKLAYRGQLDSSRPGNDVLVTGKDLRAAIDAVLAGEAVPADQTPSIGCNIKWAAEKEPEYFDPAGVS
ncbi:MAG: thioredoxin family protein [Planctomycetaceae bacterium]|nr:thioredoxin family protein [Planctomycetaceae bacterium]